MPQITVSAQLIRITRTIQPGSWILIHPDDRYEILTHEQALAMQGKTPRTRGPAIKSQPLGLSQVPSSQPVAVPLPGSLATAAVSPAGHNVIQPLAKLPITSPLDFQINGKVVHIQRQKLAILQYMAAHGPLTTQDATTLLGTDKPTTVLSTLKTLGLVTSDSNPANQYAAHTYTLTNEGRAVANGGVPTNVPTPAE